MDECNPGLLRFMDGDMRKRLTVKCNIPGISLMDTCENVHQCGFARAVFPEQGMDFPFLHTQIHAVQHRNPVKGLLYAAHL